MTETNEIVLYQPDETIKLEVRLENETVWLTQQQMAVLFETTKQNVSLHINKIFKEEELSPIATVKEYLTVQQEGKRTIKRIQKFYNLDVIISVGYRVKSRRGTQFRIWATKVLKDYLLRGYALNQRLTKIESQLDSHQQLLTEHSNKIDFFVKTSLPPVEGIFYDGQIFDAYKFANDLIRNAKQRVVLIDNYVDDSVLQMLDKRQQNVSATIYTKNLTPQLQLDVQRHNAQYAPITIQQFTKSHDRFLIIDDTVYHIGASLKDLGKKWFAFCKMDITATEVLNRII
ncbi:MAG: virulence RhuM family protein [Bacteroidales bacterium]|nr:virulence RhuM family protein [Bacteroidales bacterium]